MRRLCAFVVCLYWVSLTCLAADEPAFSAPALEHFEKHVRPLLAEHCLACHGPKKQEGGLRLDSRAALLKGGDSGAAVTVGKAEASLLIKAVRRTGDLQMPPESELSREQIQILQDWVTHGAAWPATESRPQVSAAELAKTHWSFQPVKDPQPPATKLTGWSKQSIDAFVLAKLEAAKLNPARMADRRTLIRRAKFDLLGLPPTPEEVAAFEADQSPEAYKNLIDKLLESPHYGERWARYWLDISRYADTKGYVFFEDKNYTWAYAYRDYVVRAFNEDLPFNRFILEQLAADQLDLGDDPRALAAMGYLTLGSHFMGNVHDQIDDRIDVVARGLLGMTLACARCHDHKYDPLSQDDYYALYGVFRSSNEPLVPPTFIKPVDSEESRKFQAEMTAREQKLDEFINRKRAEITKQSRESVTEYLMAVHAKRNQPSTENFMLITNPGGLNPAVIVRWEVALKEAKQNRDAIWTVWHRLSELADDQFAAQAPAALANVLHHTDQTQFAEPVHTAIREAFKDLQPKSMQEVAARYGTVLTGTHTRWQQMLEAAAKANQPAPERFPDDLSEALRQVLYGPRSPAVIPRSLGWGFLDLLPDRAAQGEYKKLLDAVEQWMRTGPAAPPRAMVLQDSETLYDPVVFLRGNPNRRGKPVERRFLSVLNREAKSFARGSGRLELAQAIASPDNPLTARVIVNRIWQQHFGEGLVRTPSDFGIRGEAPTHPELLDHLATNFMRQGWSIKALHRQIMSSATYQQRAEGTGAAVDPENKLLWQYPRRRLDYEATRDALLAVSGSLNPVLGGPPIDAINGVNPRRTLYGFIERLDLPTQMRTFDFPDPAASSGQRSATTVAPQALFFMNHNFVAECARRVAHRPELQALTDPKRRVQQLYAELFGRQPTAEEETLALEFVLARGLDAPTPTPWRYGYGRIDAATQRTADFTELTHWTGMRWQVGPALPDPQKGWVFIDQRGGHPAEHPDRAVIRRWISPITGKVQITGKLIHKQKAGNGVHARMISSRAGQIGEWKAHASEADFGTLTAEVQTGDTLDFVVDFAGEITHDEHESPFEIRQITDVSSGSNTAQLWNSEKDFRGGVITDRWQLLAHALLMTNEFVFID